MDEIVHIEPCTAKCRGRSCCDCCGEAQAMHQVHAGETLWDRFCRDCCLTTRLAKPEACMFLKGKTREEWLHEKHE